MEDAEAAAGAGDVVTGDVVTGDVVTGDVVTGEATVVGDSESDEPEHADSTRIPIVDATSGRYLLIVPPPTRVLTWHLPTDSTTPARGAQIKAPDTHPVSA